MRTSPNRAPARRFRILLLVLLMAPCVSTAMAQEQADQEPTVHAWESLIQAGDTTTAWGKGFEPGQEVTLFANGAPLNDEPFVADEEGGFKGKFDVPADAEFGFLPVAVKADGSKVARFEVKISRKVLLSGADGFSTTQNKLRPGLYQVAYSGNSNALYVTHSAAKPTPQTEILKVDAETLEIIGSTTPPASPARGSKEKYPPPVFAVFGIGVDSANQTIWVTNTLNNTVAVYRQRDLSLLKQFEPGLVPHSHSVVVDEQQGKAYASSYGARSVVVFDTRTLKHAKDIKFKAQEQDDTPFVPIGLALNGESDTLYVSSMKAPAVAVIDTTTDTVEKLVTMEHARSLRGMAWDAADDLLLVADYGSDRLLVVDPETGEVVHDVYVGASPLAVAWEPKSGLAFVSVRGGGTVAVVDPATGELVANLEGGIFPNHLVADGKGSVFAVNKSKWEKTSPNGDFITRITPDTD